jgi:hypothetical protein
MTELNNDLAGLPCPEWCVLAGEVHDHPHVSNDVTVGSGDQPVTARLVQGGADTQPQVVVNGRVAHLEELGSVVKALHRLLDQAQLAPAGLGFVDDLVQDCGLGLAEVAEAADLDVAWVRAQHAGKQVLTTHEFDRLALAVAALAVSSKAAC